MTSSHLHSLHIFQNEISLELMQIFANGKRRFYSFTESRGKNLIIALLVPHACSAVIMTVEHLCSYAKW